MTQTATIYKKVDSFVGGEASYTWTLLETVAQAAYYTGASAEQFIGERFRAEASGLVILNPNEKSHPIIVYRQFM